MLINSKSNILTLKGKNCLKFPITRRISGNIQRRLEMKHGLKIKTSKSPFFLRRNDLATGLVPRHGSTSVENEVLREKLVFLSVMTNENNFICIPGQRICLVDKSHIPGPGTFERNGYIYATLAGIVEIIKKDIASLVTVCSFNNQTIVPAPEDIVTAKVMTVTNRFCKCEIKCVGDLELSRTYKAILRKEDVRATDKDRIEMYKCFRPGDIILARVLPMTEPHWYHLSTAENELGVVNAYSQAGVQLIPISWTEMQCPKTYVKEPRKVAKILPEST